MAGDLRFVCLRAAPNGIRQFHEQHPDVPVWTAAVDRGWTTMATPAGIACPDKAILRLALERLPRLAY